MTAEGAASTHTHTQVYFVCSLIRSCEHRVTSKGPGVFFFFWRLLDYQLFSLPSWCRPENRGQGLLHQQPLIQHSLLIIIVLIIIIMMTDWNSPNVLFMSAAGGSVCTTLLFYIFKSGLFDLTDSKSNRSGVCGCKLGFPQPTQRTERIPISLIWLVSCSISTWNGKSRNANLYEGFFSGRTTWLLSCVCVFQTTVASLNSSVQLSNWWRSKNSPQKST